MSVRLVAAAHPYGTPSPLSPLIGRREEIAAALALLADPEVRLLTMIGPGGIGKTRLALRVAADSSDDFAGGVLFVSLAAIRDPALVIPAIAHAAGLPESTDEAGLIEHFADLELLLLLDNFEQIVAAAPVVARLLERCPGLKALTTQPDAAATARRAAVSGRADVAAGQGRGDAGELAGFRRGRSLHATRPRDPAESGPDRA